MEIFYSDLRCQICSFFFALLNNKMRVNVYKGWPIRIAIILHVCYMTYMYMYIYI